jgi:hypothetical protein
MQGLEGIPLKMVWGNKLLGVKIIIVSKRAYQRKLNSKLLIRIIKWGQAQL